MTEVSIRAEDLLAQAQRFIGKPPMSRGEYKKEVEDLTDEVLTRHSGDRPIHEVIFEAVNNSELVMNTEYWCSPIKYHGEEPADLGAYVSGSNPIQGLAFACLMADVWAKVDEKQDK